MTNYEYVTGINTMDQIVIEERLQSEKSTEEHMADYIKSISAIEECIKPYQEQKRDLKAEYVEEGWLSKEDISLATKAYRLAKSSEDLEKLLDMVELLRSKGIVKGDED